jgi:hypothetical protein
MSHKYYNRLASWVVEEEVKRVTKMVESLTQEFKDLRNAAGFIADIVDLEYEYAKSFGIDKDWPYTAQELNSHTYLGPFTGSFTRINGESVTWERVKPGDLRTGDILLGCVHDWYKYA